MERAEQMRLRFTVKGAVVGLFLFLFMVSCSPQSPAGTGDASATGSTVTCTTGPAYPKDAVFPYDSSKPSLQPDCPMRCGAEEQVGTSLRARYLSTDLPAGQCSSDTKGCNVRAEYPCSTCAPPGAALGPRNGYYCECSAGMWACWTVSQGGDTCLTGPVCGDAAPSN
jgi:hypothetical protein